MGQDLLFWREYKTCARSLRLILAHQCRLVKTSNGTTKINRASNSERQDALANDSGAAGIRTPKVQFFNTMNFSFVLASTLVSSEIGPNQVPSSKTDSFRANLMPRVGFEPTTLRSSAGC